MIVCIVRTPAMLAPDNWTITYTHFVWRTQIFVNVGRNLLIKIPFIPVKSPFSFQMSMLLWLLLTLAVGQITNITIHSRHQLEWSVDRETAEPLLSYAMNRTVCQSLKFHIRCPYARHTHTTIMFYPHLGNINQAETHQRTQEALVNTPKEPKHSI